MVDFALLLAPPADSPLQQAMKRLLRNLPLNMKSLSQSDYGPLRHYPAPVAIETKTSSGNMEEAKVQLGVWTAAWFKRMGDLSRHGDRDNGEAMIAVPLLMVEAEQWSLYYACDEENGIVSPFTPVSLLPFFPRRLFPLGLNLSFGKSSQVYIPFFSFACHSPAFPFPFSSVANCAVPASISTAQIG
jgi:hypothetical protein